MSARRFPPPWEIAALGLTASATECKMRRGFFFLHAEEHMRKLAMSLATAAFVVGAMAITANAQAPASGANNLHAQTQKATLFKGAACRGWGAHCPPGRVWRCGPYGRCGCVLC